MNKHRFAFLVAAVGACGGASTPFLAPHPPRPAGHVAQAFPIPRVESFTLQNGLTVLVHEDHKAPVVSVDVLYRVGSKDEKPGKTGLAHLVEHLMFYGTVHAPADWFQLAAKYGFTDIVGQTHNDVSRFGETVPTAALDAALWLESDRMGFLAAAVTQERLDAQRRVVENEVAQGLNEPYGGVLELIAMNSYPRDHPYHWEALGSMEELRTATVTDVREWLEKYYVPNNAVLILSGDIDVAHAQALTTKYFGGLKPGSPVPRLRRKPVPMDADTRRSIEMRVDQARIYKSWNIAGLGTPDYDALRLFADVLGRGPNSRLHKRLVTAGMATDASVWIHPKELGSSLVVQVTAPAGRDSALAGIENIIDDEIEELIATGPSDTELGRVRSEPRNWLLREFERVGGYGGQSDQIGWSYFFAGRPDYFALQLRRWAAMQPEEIRRVAAQWLRHGAFVLEVYPERPRTAALTDVDRTAIPPVREAKAPAFPALESARLANGLRVIVAHRSKAAIVAARLLIGGGLAADVKAGGGTGAVLVDLMTRGATGTSREEHDRLLAENGARLTSRTEFDAFALDVSSPRASFDRALALLSAGVLAPRIDAEAVDQTKREVLTTISQDLGSPRSLARRVLPSFLYPTGHEYAAPWTGTGTIASVTSITPETLTRFKNLWFRPNNATLVLAGDITLDSAVVLAERAFGRWDPGEVPVLPAVGFVSHPTRDTIFAIHRAGATQTEIAAGYVVQPTSDSSEVTLEAVARVLGLGANSRLGRNLRDEKNWAYSTSVFRPDAKGARPFVIHAAVRPERTADAAREILREVRELSGERRVTPDELQRVTNFLWLGSASRLQSTESLALAAARSTLFDLPADFHTSYADVVRKISPTGATATAAKALGGRPVLLIVGDSAVIEAQLRGAGLGPLKFVRAQ